MINILLPLHYTMFLKKALNFLTRDSIDHTVPFNRVVLLLVYNNDLNNNTKYTVDHIKCVVLVHF